MLICIPEVLDHDDLAMFRQSLDAADWIDGGATAGKQSGAVKRNQQLGTTSETAVRLGQRIVERLSAHPLFLSAALPARILPPLFNKYALGEDFGVHVDNAIRVVQGANERIRTDLSCTLFLAEPDEYDGGELIVEDNYGSQSIKLAAGDMVLYPSTSLHRVTPVTRGARVASFFWLQSMVRLDAHRALLFDLDQTIQALAAERGLNDPACVRLTGIYHNMIRLWAEV